jgi:1-deoxy-D-xylulose-5-phosphate reductoisomerase
VARLEFEPPDLARFPCLRLARAVAERGQTAPAVLNAANEVAVEAFLQGRLPFMDIPNVIELVLSQHDITPVSSLHDVLRADEWARRSAQVAVNQIAGVVA